MKMMLVGLGALSLAAVGCESTGEGALYGAALGAALLWLGYAAVLWRHRGQVLDCGCDLVAREKPVDDIAIATSLRLLDQIRVMMAQINAGNGPHRIFTCDCAG